MGWLSLVVYSQAGSVLARNPKVIQSKFLKLTVPLKQFKPDPTWVNVKVRDENGIISVNGEEEDEEPEFRRYPSKTPFLSDPANQLAYKQSAGNALLNTASIQNFSGMEYANVNPPDPSIAVGPNHIIQMVNGSSGAYFKVFDKAGGQVVAQTYLDALSGKGGLGDPITMYDQLADRFIMTEFVNKNEVGTQGLVFAVSQTSDPAGSWYVYFFNTGNLFPDYPKYSVWPDAYYATSNDYTDGVSFYGTSAMAFDRNKMLAGDTTATMQKFKIGGSMKLLTSCPVTLQGTNLPPVGMGGQIAYMLDDTWTGSQNDVDSIGLIEFKVDFANPANTVITMATSLATLPFKSDICSATRGQCVPMPGTTVRVEVLNNKIMNQPVYRNFGNRQGIVLTHIVDKGNSIAAPRWYELIKTTGNWNIAQQSTFAPDNVYRWMPAIGYDAAGNISLAYNVSDSSSVFPGIRYTGRKSCDPPNTMTYEETTIALGATRSASTRYGDYNNLVCDPNGTDFWFTGEWNNTPFWSTKIASYSLDNCAAVSCGKPTGLAASGISNNTANVSWAGVNGATSYNLYYKLSDSAVWQNIVITDTAYSLNGLIPAKTYNWKVTATCPAGTSSYDSLQFSTTANCGMPSSLSSSVITTQGATVSWATVADAINYILEYKNASAGTWTVAAPATTSTSFILSGLDSSTTYDLRVAATCTYGVSEYVTEQFVTATPCGNPTDLTNSVITNTEATVSWAAVPGANSYAVEYKSNSTSVWTIADSSTTATTVTVSGLDMATVYDWRVVATCAFGPGNYAVSQFVTASPCGNASGLSSSAITTTSATVSWAASSGANSYTIEYKPNASATWIIAASNIVATSQVLSGLNPATVYDWRIKVNCQYESSNYVSAQFTTLTPCGTPAGLSTTSLTTTSATVNWTALAGANNYTVEYKPNTSTTWMIANAAATTTSQVISGLASSTLYNWRLTANCNSGIGSSVSSQFTTLTPCGTASGLSSSFITTNSAIVSWASVSGATSYSLEYKIAAAATWIVAASATTNTTITLTGLTDDTLYSWRVKATCISGAGGFASAQFTTLPLIVCAESYESNNTLATAATVPVGVNILSQLPNKNDIDYFSFSNTSAQKNMQITLTNLPANYDLKLYNAAGTNLKTSQNTGTLDESISYNNGAVGQYRVHVYPKGNTPNTTLCYTLKINLSSSTFNFDEIYLPQAAGQTGFEVYPVPAKNKLRVSYTASQYGKSFVTMINETGVVVYSKEIDSNEGPNAFDMDVTKLPNGVYHLKLFNGNGSSYKKVMILH